MYHLVYGFLYLLSLLPIRMLYILSDGFYILTYYVIGYRKEVVMHNLGIAFPDKTKKEKINIARRFYHNFIDNFIETIKMLSASDDYIYRRFTGNWDVVNEMYKTGRSCHLLLGHTFNWEWGNHSASAHLHYTFLVVYMPIGNTLINRLFYKLRSKGKTVLLAATNMRKELMPYRRMQYALALAADQNPGSAENAYWLNFFGRPAPFVTGPEKGARGQNFPVFFCNIEKRKRGFYHLTFSLGEENPQQLTEGALTVRYVRYLEEVIRKQPDMWLWSHKRWKHSWKEDYAKLWIDEGR
ncbi:MAG: lysophospholipid acyltransferase family protein [Chitinophagaceae bacterium]